MEDSSAPPLTLREIREHGIVNHEIVMAARQHVGAAGIEQITALERVVAVGRGQPSIIRALRHISQTLQGESTGTSAADTEELLATTHEQLRSVQLLGEIVTEALEAVRATPIEFISAAALTKINLGAREQLTSLEELVHEVQHRTTSEPQAHLLEQVDQQVHEALDAIGEQEAHGQVESLELTGQMAVEQIAALDQAPIEHQIAALESVAETAQKKVEALRLQAAAEQIDHEASHLSNA